MLTFVSLNLAFWTLSIVITSVSSAICEALSINSPILKKSDGDFKECQKFNQLSLIVHSCYSVRVLHFSEFIFVMLIICFSAYVHRGKSHWRVSL